MITPLNAAVTFAALLARIQVFGPVVNHIVEIEKEKKKIIKSDTRIVEVAMNPAGVLVFSDRGDAIKTTDFFTPAMQQCLERTQAERKESLIRFAKETRTQTQTQQLVHALSQADASAPNWAIHKSEFGPERYTVSAHQSTSIRFVGQTAEHEAEALCSKWRDITAPFRLQAEELVRADIIGAIEKAFS